MIAYEATLERMGIRLPETPKPVAAYLPAVLVDGYVYVSGQVARVDGELRYPGKLGGNVTESDGYQAARICALNCLSAVKAVIGSLANIERMVKLTGYVASADGFANQPMVINGPSERLGESFGEAGRHARAAVRVAELPLGASVEVEMIVKVVPEA